MYRLVSFSHTLHIHLVSPRLISSHPIPPHPTPPHPIPQAKLGQAGNYIADILATHHHQPATVKAACRAVSVLAHGNITNR